MSVRIIVLYNDKSFEFIKPKKLYKVMRKRDEIKYLLFPSLHCNYTYHVIKPDRRLLSSIFKVKAKLEISSFDFDEKYGERIDTIDIDYETTSVLQFVDCISVFYKSYGFAETIESSFIEQGPLMHTIYPIYYHIDFDSNYESIDSGLLESVNRGLYLHQDTYQWIYENRMDSLSDILLTIDSNKNNIHRLPLLLALRDDKYVQIKKVNHISDMIQRDDYLLMNLPGYASYMLLPYDQYRRLTEVSAMNLNIIIYRDNMIQDSLYRSFSLNIDNSNQVERNALCMYLNDSIEYYMSFRITLADAYIYGIWLSFSTELIGYIISIFKNFEEEQSYPVKLLLRHVDTLIESVFTYNDIKDDKLYNYILYHITKGGNIK